MSEAVHEVAHEATHEAAHSGKGAAKMIGLLISVLALFLAVSEMLGKGAQTHALALNIEASDTWNFFQAKSLKKNMYEIAAAGGGPKAEEYGQQAKRYDSEQEGTKRTAEDFEHRSEARLTESEHHERRHHVLTVAVTMLHISIAVATIAIITRGMRWPWLASMALGAAGVATAGWAYL